MNVSADGRCNCVFCVANRRADEATAVIAAKPLVSAQGRAFEFSFRPPANNAQKDEPAKKFDAGKPQMELIAPEFLEDTAKVLTFGAQKYAERNWEKGMSWGRCFGALMRHCWAWWRGEENDPETGLPHLAHASCCLMFLHAYSRRGIGKDDRSKLSA